MRKILLLLALALAISVVAQNVFANDKDHHGDHHKKPAVVDVVQNHDHDHDGHGHNHDDHGHDH